ncbi:MAG TPA: AraC family transcriptional regulator, partial [Longimicrobiales bacterium]|nr:AraC family transcriptional regulator [Longimicrobiales bacterium]
QAITAQRDSHSVAVTRSWKRLLWLVRERPVTGAVVDAAALPPDLSEDGAVRELGRSFPSVATVFVARPNTDPVSLFRLGRAGLGGLVLLPDDQLYLELPKAIRHARGTSTDAIVTRAVSPFVPFREAAALRIALEGVQRGWNAEELASRLGLTRPHASVRLKSCGLPSTGHLLIWAKLLHAGRWLCDPGRTAESVSRQLDYSSGAAFRRALRNYVGLTPTQVKAYGGLRVVLDRFLDACGLLDRLQIDRSVA